MNALSALASFYKEGGLFMHVVLAIGLIVGAIIAERFIVIGKAMAIDARAFVDAIVTHARRGDWNGARHTAMQSGTPLARVAQAMLESGAQDEESLQRAADDATTLQLPSLSKRLAWLGLLANSATLIGLLGTITGLITAIAGVGVADAATRSAKLSAGISEALHCTAFGLTVAIPTLIVQGWFISRVEELGDSIDQLAIRLGKVMSAPAQSATQAVRPVRPQVAAQPVRQVAGESGTR
ncbi:MAG: MotA/TolQ/ExbB proton channel family protein [Candidatus Eisenbacteria bacterium]|nr:MotA/TolQ/ExbB proton channel family protein [Candidatus Eisenbacteria bacterium]